jgi:hypothetical protein
MFCFNDCVTCKQIGFAQIRQNQINYFNYTKPVSIFVSALKKEAEQ